MSSLTLMLLQAEIPLTFVVGIDQSIEKMVEKAQDAQRAGFTTVKVKGRQDVRQDVERLTMMREGMGPNGPWLRLDANTGYNKNPASA